MKNYLIAVALFFSSTTLIAQDNDFILSGGYVFTNIEEVDDNATGWRINGSYNYNPTGAAFSNGFSFGYLRTTASSTTIGNSTTEYKLSSFPIYYAPKFQFGGESFKGFIKGAIGAHFSSYKRINATELKTSDIGFYGGASVGAAKYFSNNMFLNLEYEWAYLSNFAYRDGFVNTAMLGVGLKF